MKKKFLAILLACMMAASVVPAAVSATGDVGGMGSTFGASTQSEVTVTDENSLKSAISDATEGTVIKLGQNIELTSTLTIDKKVTIDGGQHTISVADTAGTWPTDNSSKYMVVVFRGATIQNVTIDAKNNASGCLQFYATTGGAIQNVTLQNAKQLGLNVNASTVTATGTVTLSGNGWGDIINVGWGSGASNASGCSFNASGATLVGVDQIYSDSDDVSHAGGDTNKFTIQTSNDYVPIEDSGNPVCYVPISNVEAVLQNPGTSEVSLLADGVLLNGKYYSSFENAIANAQDGATITLMKDVTVESAISLNNRIILDGNGYSITAANSVTDNFVTVLKDGTKLENVKLVAGTASKNVLHIYQADNVVLTNVTLDHSKAADGAPMIVNESDVTVEGNLTMITGTNSWYAVNVDSKESTANLNFATGSSVTYTDTSTKNLPLIGIDQEGNGQASVTDNTGKIVAASIGEGGEKDFYNTLDQAVDAAEATNNSATVKVLQSGLSATVDTSKNVKFDLSDGVTAPTLIDQHGNVLEIKEDGSVAIDPDAQIYTATINGQTASYRPGTVVPLNTPLYTYDGRVFVKWVVASGNVTLANAYSNSTTFVMPAANVEVYPYYTYVSYTPVVPDVPDYTPVKPSQPAEPEIEWTKENGNTYLYIDGEMITGWYQNDDGWYWFDEQNGVMSADGWEKINGVWYLFGKDGIMLTGWQKVDGSWYYLKPWGGMVTGWQKIDSVWYFFRGNGVMAANSWVQSNGQWYYMTGSGEMATNKWVEWKGDWYYLYSSGAMATNATIDGYYVDSNGIWRA